VTKSPSSSFSQANFSALAAGLVLDKTGLEVFVVPPKRPRCPLFLIFSFSLPISNSFSILKSRMFLSSKLSKAPALIKASRDFLLMVRTEIRCIKSKILANCPPFLRTATISSTRLTPTFLIAAKPKRILELLGMTVKP